MSLKCSRIARQVVLPAQTGAVYSLALAGAVQLAHPGRMSIDSAVSGTFALNHPFDKPRT
jgi:hypothetical protein